MVADTKAFKETQKLFGETAEATQKFINDTFPASKTVPQKKLTSDIATNIKRA